MRTPSSPVGASRAGGRSLAFMLLAIHAWGTTPVSRGASPEIRASRVALDALYASATIPGLAVAVAVDGEIVWAEGRGHADLERKIPASPETQFRLASVSKLMTAAALARLADRGKLRWHAPIQTYVEFPDKGHVITPYRVAGHLGGIRSYDSKDFVEGRHIDRRHFDTTTRALDIFKDDPLVAVPGTEYHYSTLGYSLLMGVVEGAGGSDFLSVIDRLVFEPLGMTRTQADRSAAGTDEPRTTFYEHGPDGFREAMPIDPSYKWGGGGLLSTATDLVRLGQAHFAPGFLQPETLEFVLESQRTTSGIATEVGVGWRISTDAWGRKVAHHAGSMTGARSVLLVYPEHRVAVALLTNIALNPLAAEATAQILADPFVYRASESRSAPRVFLVGDYEYELADTGERGRIRFGGGSSFAGTLATPSTIRSRAERFGIGTSDVVDIVSIRLDETEGLLTVATPLGLVGIRARFGEDEFDGEFVALHSPVLTGRLRAWRLKDATADDSTVQE